MNAKVDTAKYTASIIPSAKLSIYDGIGHSPSYEDAPRFNSPPSCAWPTSRIDGRHPGEALRKAIFIGGVSFAGRGSRISVFNVSKDQTIPEGPRIRFDLLLFVSWDRFFAIDKHGVR
jgi:hypothetical protein